MTIASLFCDFQFFNQLVWGDLPAHAAGTYVFTFGNK